MKDTAPIAVTSRAGPCTRYRKFLCGTHSRAMPMLANASVLYGDMRPGMMLYATAVSRNSNSSMARFQPNTYSAAVARPSMVTNAAKAVANFCSTARDGQLRMNKAVPAAVKPNAVLAFISTAPGTILLNKGTSANQPDRTTNPNKTVSAAAM